MQLRPFQIEALAALERGGHVLCVAPTGAGKSLIYERAALKSGRKTLLITPLVALARQQFASLSLKSEVLRPKLGAGPQSQRPERESGLWIVSPEKLLSSRSQEILRAWRPDFLVVDECHCLWEWGEHFRPAFKKIPQLLEQFRIASSLWLTATLPAEAREELRQQIPAPLTELGRFDLPKGLEVTIAQVPWRDRTSALWSWITQQRTPGIVFVATRENSDRLTRLILATGKTVVGYHAGMSAEERLAIERQIAERLPDVIVATSAFGMGMNYPELGWALLWQAPPSLLAMAQAIGRVGRGPQHRGRARAIVFWDPEDFRLLEWASRQSARSRQQIELTHQYLRTSQCRRTGLQIYFDGARPDKGLTTREGTCGLCDFCGRVEGITAAGTRAG